jgi:hypothetical protein
MVPCPRRSPHIIFTDAENPDVKAVFRNGANRRHPLFLDFIVRPGDQARRADAVKFSGREASY